MRLLLDEDIDVRFRLVFSESHEVQTVTHRGWKGLKNGDLLDRAQEEFDVLLTLDDHLTEQQNLSKYNLAVVILRPRTQNLSDLSELVEENERLLQQLRPGESVRVLPV